ncbi:DUF2250 domain-containing protein [Candidatus Woesearchaeota archaeon]|nr:DUF2250 domain-containing protein [Candidatus Woesearchaeota archaeon]
MNKKIGLIMTVLAIVLLVTLTFVKINMDKQSAFLCKMVEKDPEVTMDQCPAHENPASWLIIIAFGISFAVLAGGVYLTLKHTKKPVTGLDADEKKVLEIVKETGSAYQSDIIKQTEFSKVKVTRIVDKLEQKGIVERKRRGMTNLIVLK